MAVLLEAISVIVKRKSIDGKITGGWLRFIEAVPNGSLCTDGELARVGFMTPTDVTQFLQTLEDIGLTFLTDEGSAVDFCVVDQLRGPTTDVDWLEIAKLKIDEHGNHVSACWLFEGPRESYGIHMKSLSMQIATPIGWNYEDSLSKHVNFIPNEEVNNRLQFLRHEDGIDVYWDNETGTEVFSGRTALNDIPVNSDSENN
jgi:hypothetical protein